MSNGDTPTTVVAPSTYPAAVANSVSVVVLNHPSAQPCTARTPSAVCTLIFNNVSINGGPGVDVWVVHCPYGPPCP